jgi:hypothetical protein
MNTGRRFAFGMGALLALGLACLFSLYVYENFLLVVRGFNQGLSALVRSALGVLGCLLLSLLFAAYGALLGKAAFTQK